MIEDDLEQLVLETLSDLGWDTVYGPTIAPLLADEVAGPGRNPERLDYRETVLIGRLRQAVADLNPDLPTEAVEDVIQTVTRAESPVVESENWRAYRLLTDGVAVEYRDAAGELASTRARLVDWEDVSNNDTIAVNQFTIDGPKRQRRPDIVLFVNGLPVALFELKRPGKPYAKIQGAWRQVQTYRSQVPDIFAWNQATVISDGIQARVGSFSADWEHFAPWKTIDGAGLASAALPQIEVLVEGLFRQDVFFDWVRNYIATYGDGEKTIKKVAKYHQYWAVRKAVDCTLQAVAGDGRIGVVWHTQGSGKSLEMAFYAGRVMTHPEMQNPTILVLTDRNDLDDQLLDETFAASKLGSPLPEMPVQAGSRAELKAILAGRLSGGIVFSTIQKFGVSREEKESGRGFPTLSERRNIVVLVDEAHRSNYDLIDGFARHLRDALPNASFIGFTGTPIEESDRSTRAIFGEYIDTYDMTQAQQDGATVKVYYEPRLAKVELPDEVRDSLDDEFVKAVSGAEEDLSERLKGRWAQVEAIVGSDKRLRQLASDIVDHWEGRRGVLAGKAMIVTMSRRIAVELHDHIVTLRPEWHTDDDKTGVIKVVMTGDATDPAEFQPHIRSKRDRNAIKDRACDPNDSLELVIVRDLWLTGFDSPPMHTMYTDKPMKGASLMQAITRVNRTFRDKPAGLVVDYIGIAEDLKNALKTYTRRDHENRAAGDDVRVEAIPALLVEHDVIVGILAGFDWATMLAAHTSKAYLRAIAATVNYLLESDRGEDDEGGAGEFDSEGEVPSLKKRFMAHVGRLTRLFRIVSTSEEATTIRDDVAFFEAVRSSIAKIEGVDREGPDTDAQVETAIKQLVSEHVAGTGVIDLYGEAGMEQPDLSVIDDKFMARFQESDQKNLQLELLRRLISKELRAVGRRNVVAERKFSEMLSDSMNRYQNRSLDTAQVVAELFALAQALKSEQDRGEATGLDEDELAFYDAIRTNASAVSLLEDTVMRQIAHELTEIVRRDAKTDWSVKEQVRAKLRSTIKRLLLRHGYPPDKEPAATDLILRQAALVASKQ
ncbi:type I restriction endonuclease subunit R [Cellulomonas aerilata]|uniref:Type I restriction enzyme endonuclease subunit n=1 Tax=Cellulomonas aerilata TaxID=515326 RepID=A0A512D775_9CELL|nr:type I restriction endonuclease subunit R [Cellulomonas aerilata]GEO32326.1 DEAD/DEAH box helicase [Cellulomonas aerilata]